MPPQKTGRFTPRAVFKEKLTGSKKKTHIDQMFKGSGAYIEVEPNQFGALIVDEAHRLNEKSGLYSNLGENQIKELIEASKFNVFFIDEAQKVTLQAPPCLSLVPAGAVTAKRRKLRLPLN